MSKLIPRRSAKEEAFQKITKKESVQNTKTPKLTGVQKKTKPKRKVPTKVTIKKQPTQPPPTVETTEEINSLEKSEFLLQQLTENSWKDLLEDVLLLQEAQLLSKKLEKLYESQKIRPSIENLFRALNICPLDKVKVVILGQDPYHGDQQADGLAFSVPTNQPVPPSLKNIFKELTQDAGVANFTQIPNSGDLTEWAKQGVLLLNCFLTVELGQPCSHSKLGWPILTKRILELVNSASCHVVFMLWGKHSQDFWEKLNLPSQQHLILTAAHPSGMTCGKFFGCKHFSKANEFLQTHGISTIDWNLL